MPIDKRSCEHRVRIPAKLKAEIDRLTQGETVLLNEAILVAIAKYLHDRSFDASYYLDSDYRE